MCFFEVDRSDSIEIEFELVGSLSYELSLYVGQDPPL